MRSLPLLLLALSGPALAGSGAEVTPLAHVMLAPDGSYDLMLQSSLGWDEAEITVSGDGSHDVGAVGEDEPFHLEGLTSVQGPLHVTVQAVTPDEHGMTRMFTVDPELVPMRAPVGSESLGNRDRSGLFGIFKMRR